MNAPLTPATLIALLDRTGGSRNEGIRTRDLVRTCRTGPTTEQLRAATKAIGAQVECVYRTHSRHTGQACHWVVWCPGWIPGVSAR